MLAGVLSFFADELINQSKKRGIGISAFRYRPVAAVNQSLLAKALPKDIEDRLIVFDVLGRRLRDGALIEPRDLAGDVGVLGQSLHGCLPFGAGRLAIEIVTEAMVHHDMEIRDGARDLVNRFNSRNPTTVRQIIHGEVVSG